MQFSSSFESMSRLQAHSHGIWFSIEWANRLISFQSKIERLRNELLTQNLNESFLLTQSKRRSHNADEIYEKDGDFIEKLRSRREITHISVSWLHTDTHDKYIGHVLPIQQHYFKPFATEPICESYLSASPGWYRHWKNIMSCNMSSLQYHISAANLTDTLGKEIKHRSPSYAYHLNQLYSYVSIVKNAYVNKIGDVINGDVIIRPISCIGENNSRHRYDGVATLVSKGVPVMDYIAKSVLSLDEVFVTSQYWGDGHFHMNVENLPRLAPYVEFLQRHENIYIHMAPGPENFQRWAIHANETLKALGIDPKRIVRNTVRAKIVYLPRSTQCVHGLLPEMQILAKRYHNFIETKLLERRHSSLILIVRESPSGNRNIPRPVYDYILLKLGALLFNSKLTLEVFDDKDNPSYYETVRMFYRAKIIVGMHGAGLVNMIYSRPGTQIIEMLCQPPTTNLCFATQAGVLGHRYHAFPANGCPLNVTINVDQLLQVIEIYLKLMTESNIVEQ